MALPLSVKRQQDKKKKFEKELVNFLKQVPARFLKDELQRAFHSSTPPNASEFVKIVSSAKFGGGNFWTAGATGPKLITALVNSMWPKHQSLLDDFSKDESIGWAVLQPTFVGHLMHYIHFFPTLAPHIENINPDEYRHAREISQFLFLEKEANLYGFLLLPLPTVNAHEAEQFLQKANVWNPEKSWTTTGFMNWTPNEAYSTGPLEYVSPFLFYFGTLEELAPQIPNRDELDVSGHFRRLQSGRVVPVRSHRKRKPIRSKAIVDEITNHIVYQVFDKDGILKYIGEGKPDRYLHVNSGVSHNKKINEHYFLHGEMNVEKIATDLSKSEALALERLLLNQMSGSDLWNIKDYEPYTDNLDKRFTDSEISDYIYQNMDEDADP